MRFPAFKKARVALTLSTLAIVALPLALALPAEARPAPTSGLRNGGFEESATTSPVPGWQVSATGANVSLVKRARTGKNALKIQFTAEGTATVSQVLTGQNASAYDVQVWTRSNGLDGGSVAVGGTEWRRTSIPISSTWKPVTVRGVRTASGQIEVRFELTGSAGQEVLFDDTALTAGNVVDDFLAGGDLTQLNYIESLGGVFRDETGAVRDPVELMAENGVTLARLRLYNDTGPENHRIGYPDSYLEDGFQDPEDILNLARRARDAGMQIQLTFHYSDYWTNGEIQDIPLEWRYVNDLPYDQAVAELERLVYEYTSDFLDRMVAQGTPPAYVALGNETAGGLLLPYGGSWQEGGSLDVMADFLTAGANAVHETLPDAKVILHLDAAGDQGKYEWWFGEIEKRGVPYDVIGSSYYPFWTQKDVATVAPFFTWAHERFGKPVMIMETGFNWHPVTHDGVEGQLHDNYRYGEDPISQRDFMRELFAAVKALPAGTVLGDIYWDPIFLGVPGSGWQVGAPNPISNTTLFDFDGVALPVFQAYRENAGSPR